MKFKFQNGLIWISVTIIYERNPIQIDNCVVDTGSATTAIDIDQIEINYLKPSKLKRLFGIGGGTQEVICQNVDALKIGEIVIPEVELEFGDLQGRLGINGFIGNDILCKFNLHIEYKSKNLKLITPY